MGATFGDPKNPSSFPSLRRPVSMPGMMDTILNLGLNEKTVRGLAENSGDARFAYDSTAASSRCTATWSWGSPGKDGRVHRRQEKGKGRQAGHRTYREDWKELVEKFKALVKQETGNDFPEDPGKQLWGSIGRSSNRGIPPGDHLSPVEQNPRGLGYGGQRPDHGLRQHGGESATGVPSPATRHRGENFLWRVPAQRPGRGRGGRDRTPAHRKNRKADPNLVSMEEMLPKPYGELEKIYQRLESTSRTCRTSSSPSSRESSGCSRLAAGSGPPSPPCGSPWRWWERS